MSVAGKGNAKVISVWFKLLPCPGDRVRKYCEIRLQLSRSSQVGQVKVGQVKEDQVYSSVMR